MFFCLLLTDPDCSGRSLATLVIAWIGAALVASVLLRWTYMWITLAVLTLLFLLACGYSAYDARRAHARALAREEGRQLERRRRRQTELETVSAGIDNFPEIIDPPEYQTYWITDLPPSYTTVVDTQPTSSRSPSPDEGSRPNASRLSNPPPYSVAIQSEPVVLPIPGEQGRRTSGEQIAGHPDQDGQFTPNNDQTGSQSAQPNVRSGGQPHAHSTTPRRAAPAAPTAGDEDKVDDTPQNANVLSTGTQYIASIINSTFGRGPRRANVDQNTAQTQAGEGVRPSDSSAETQNNRIREQSVANNDRNINNSVAVIGPPPQYTTPFSD